MRSFGKWIFLAAAAWLSPAYAQDMMDHVDLSSPKFSSAEMTRAEIETSHQDFAAWGPRFFWQKSQWARPFRPRFYRCEFSRGQDEPGQTFGCEVRRRPARSGLGHRCGFFRRELEKRQPFRESAARGELRRGRSFGCPHHRRFVARQSARMRNLRVPISPRI